jgi:hypothetical protein
MGRHEPDPEESIVPLASSRRQDEQIAMERGEWGAHLPWGEEGVVLGAGAVLPLQPGCYGGGGHRHRSAEPCRTCYHCGWGGGGLPPQRRRCRTTGIATASGLVSLFENILGLVGQGVPPGVGSGPEGFVGFRLSASESVCSWAVANSWAAPAPLDERSYCPRLNAVGNRSQNLFLSVQRLGTVSMVGVNIYLKKNNLSLLFASTNICLLGCLDGVINVDVDVDERGRAGLTTNLLQFATF